MPSARNQYHPHILAILKETRVEDPFVAVRLKARAVAERYHQLFSATPPFDMRALASLQGLHWSEDNPRFSQDSEIAPRADGRVEIRVNRERPRTRQHFSIGHEIGHTLFPEYDLKVQCRKVIDRDWVNPSDLIEALCDAASTELLFPDPWFSQSLDARKLDVDSIADLAGGYQASRDATVRRMVELHSSPLAAVFLHWKWKPTELSSMKRSSKQRRLPGALPTLPEKKLRVDYAVINDRFAAQYGDHIPKDKSVPSAGPIFDASTGHCCCDGKMSPELGSVQGRFTISALPIYTSEAMLGDNGELAVVAVLSPAKKPSAR